MNYLENQAQGRTRWLMPEIPALCKTKVGGSPEVRSSRPPWLTWQNPVSTKNSKISRARWCMPVIPGTPEGEAGESLEPKSCNERSSHHCIPVWVTEQDSISKIKCTPRSGRHALVFPSLKEKHSQMATKKERSCCPV